MDWFEVAELMDISLDYNTGELVVIRINNFLVIFHVSLESIIKQLHFTFVEPQFVGWLSS